MRKPLIAANWKMHKTQESARAFIDTFLSYNLPSNHDVLIAASPTLLPLLSEILYHRDILLAAQNMHFEDEGAFTGEVSPTQLVDLGVTHVLIGHSERRHLFGETPVMLNKKMHAAQKHHIVPIYCIGETAEEHAQGKTMEVVTEQLQAGLAGVSETFSEKIIVAYEPVWAIGTGNAATPEHVNQIHTHIRSQVSEHTRILYGGSVAQENAGAFFACQDIDGFLVGSASLQPHDFFDIIQATI